MTFHPRRSPRTSTPLSLRQSFCGMPARPTNGLLPTKKLPAALGTTLFRTQTLYLRPSANLSMGALHCYQHAPACLCTLDSYSIRYMPSPFIFIIPLTTCSKTPRMGLTPYSWPQRLCRQRLAGSFAGGLRLTGRALKKTRHPTDISHHVPLHEPQQPRLVPSDRTSHLARANARGVDKELVVPPSLGRRSATNTISQRPDNATLTQPGKPRAARLVDHCHVSSNTDHLRLDAFTLATRYQFTSTDACY